MCILWKLDEIFYRYQLGTLQLWCDLVLELLYWFFCLNDLSIGDRGVLKSPTTTVLDSYMPLGPSEYVWWNWVHWHWVHIGW
jgi:hypothetical protein